MLNISLNDQVVEAIADTGSGLVNIACKGSSVASKVQIYIPEAASPPWVPLAGNSSACKLNICAHSVSGTCLINPELQGSCEYFYRYLDGTNLSARAYSSNVALVSSSPSASNPTLLSKFYFGCSYKSSSDPLFWQFCGGLIGLNWESSSLWGQLRATGTPIGDNLFLCMGDGTPTIDGKQAGLLAFGSNDAKLTVSQSSTLKREVIKIKMLSGSSGYRNQTFIRLNQLSFEGAPLIASAAPYAIDSGSSVLLLVTDAFIALNNTFCSSIMAASPWSDCVSFGRWDTSQRSEAEIGYGVLLNSSLTLSDLDRLFSPIVFDFDSSDGPVKYYPSSYLIKQQGYIPPPGSTVYPRGLRWTLYWAPILSTSYINPKMNFGILGNAWLNKWLVKINPGQLEVTMTKVDSCNNITY